MDKIKVSFVHGRCNFQLKMSKINVTTQQRSETSGKCFRWQCISGPSVEIYHK